MLSPCCHWALRLMAKACAAIHRIALDTLPCNQHPIQSRARLHAFSWSACLLTLPRPIFFEGFSAFGKLRELQTGPASTSQGSNGGKLTLEHCATFLTVQALHKKKHKKNKNMFLARHCMGSYSLTKVIAHCVQTLQRKGCSVSVRPQKHEYKHSLA